MEVSLAIILATGIALVMRYLRQPLIIGYIITGILAGPAFLNIVKSEETFAVLAHFGVALLLFIVGLNLNPRIDRSVYVVSTITGIGQVVFTTAVGYFVSVMLGYSAVTSLYVAIAMSFSSTIIIMKLLSDKGDMDSLYGRISIGFLIVQDIIAVIILLVVSSTTGASSGIEGVIMGMVRGSGLLVVVAIVSIIFFPRVMPFIARSQELLFLFSIGWCLAIASLFLFFNLSIEIGALLAGITLSLTQYHYEISAKMRPLRDFFIIIFFILLGSQMVLQDVGSFIVPIVVFSVLILIGNPIIVMALMGVLGYTKRNGFLAGLTVAQISEFSLILVAFGASLGHVERGVLAVLTYVGLITFAGCTYMMMYSNQLYAVLSPYLGVFERKGPKRDEHRYHENKGYDIIIFGHNRIGYEVVEAVKKLRKSFMVVDYDPNTVVGLAKQGISCRYGDASDEELLSEIPFDGAKMIISTIPDAQTNAFLIKKVQERNKKAIIMCVSLQIEDALRLYEEGASYVIMPHSLGGAHTSALIEEYGFDAMKFLQERMKHLNSLQKRKNQGRDRHDARLSFEERVG